MNTFDLICITVGVEGGSEETLWEDQERGHLHPQAGRGADPTQARWAQVSAERRTRLEEMEIKANMFPNLEEILVHLLFFRHALDIREHYERKLERANNLYMELSAIMLQLEVREKELMKYVKKVPSSRQTPRWPPRYSSCFFHRGQLLPFCK